MRKLSKTIFALSLAGLLPLASWAAFDDVTLTADQAIISTNGATVTVSGSDASLESITVESTYFTVRLVPGSSLKVSSSDNYKINHDTPTGFVVASTCNSDESSLNISMPSTHSGTYSIVEIIPTTTSCTSSGGGGGIIAQSSGGGGGGGSSYTPSAPYVSPTPATPAVVVKEEGKPAEVTLPTPPATPSPVASMVSPVFNRALTIGSTGEDVKRLQQLLNSDPDTQIATAGVGSKGSETEYFGSLTERAIQAFQRKHGVANAGDPGYGFVGPKTRAKLAEVFEGGTVPASEATLPTPPATPSSVASMVSPVFNRGITIGTTGEDVKRLQQLLNSDPDTQVATTGVGSSGNETEYFGSLTERAVQAFQRKHGVANAGDPGYGFVGPKTRAKLAEVFEGGTVPAQVETPATPPPATGELPAPAASTPPTTQSLEAQLSDLLEQLTELQTELDAKTSE